MEAEAGRSRRFHGASSSGARFFAFRQASWPASFGSVRRHAKPASPYFRCSRVGPESGDEHMRGTLSHPGCCPSPYPSRCYPCSRSASPWTGQPSSPTASSSPSMPAPQSPAAPYAAVHRAGFTAATSAASTAYFGRAASARSTSKSVASTAAPSSDKLAPGCCAACFLPDNYPILGRLPRSGP